MTWNDILEAACSLQLCAGQLSLVKAAIHAVRTSYEYDRFVCALLVDENNAFNSLNQQTALHNILHLCPTLAKIVINCYRNPTDLTLGRVILKSEEGTTQGDLLAMPFYVLATVPLIMELSVQGSAKQIWYADNFAAISRIT